MLKIAMGFVLALLIGVGCRWFGIPLPAPATIMGAALRMAVASGYTATDDYLTRQGAAPPAVASSSQVARQTAAVNGAPEKTVGK